MDELKADGQLTLDINGEKVVLLESDLLIETAQTEGYVSAQEGEVTVALDTNLTPELIEEGFVREIISKVQTMRKEAGFEVMDKIAVSYEGTEKAEKVFADNASTIADETLALEVTKAAPAGYTKEWKINGEAVTIGSGKEIIKASFFRREVEKCIIQEFEKRRILKEMYGTNVKTLFRKEVEEATPQQLFQAVFLCCKGSHHR